MLGRAAMDIEVVVEIPRGTRNKYESDPTGAIWLDRMLFTSTRYPHDYGYLPGTLGEDGDPLDAMVILEEPTFPGCHIHARPIGVFRMRDEEGLDAKILCVPATDPRFEAVRDIADVAEHERHEIAHFFDIYKDLEPGKRTEITGWEGRETAEMLIDEGRARFKPDAGAP
jgi:inorganic pyrophosphatase